MADEDAGDVGDRVQRTGAQRADHDPEVAHTHAPALRRRQGDDDDRRESDEEKERLHGAVWYSGGAALGLRGSVVRIQSLSLRAAVASLRHRAHAG